MKCPHCTLEIHENWDINVIEDPETSYRLEDRLGLWFTSSQTCPACNNAIVRLETQNAKGKVGVSILVYPRGTTRAPLPPEVPAEFAKDYLESCLVRDASPQASAALSRRCLQHVLREAGKTRKKDLADQIEEVPPSLPTPLAELIDAVRVIGNFAAHPTKSSHTGEIIEVDPVEAEMLLEVLEAVFDFYCVQPALLKKKRDSINAKLKEAGKPPMKQPKPTA